jgi:N-acetylneuraminic acid mutarotase
MPVEQSEWHGTAVGNKLSGFGGEKQRTPFDNGKASNEVRSYDPIAKTWGLATSRMPEARNHVTVVSMNDKTYLFGGYPQTCCNSYPWPFGTTNNWEYTPATDTWKTLKDIPREYGAGGGVAYQGKIYIMGGTTNGQFNSVGTLHVYDPVTDAWTEKKAMKFPREHCRAVVVENKIYVVGGHTKPEGANNSQRANRAEVEAYDPATDTWNTITNLPEARGGIGIGYIAGKMVVVGGELAVNGTGAKPVTRVDIFDPETKEWAVGPEYPLVATGGAEPGIHGMADITHAGKLYILAGAIRGGFAPGNIAQVYSPPEVSGCMTAGASNFNRYATVDDGSCTVSLRNPKQALTRISGVLPFGSIQGFHTFRPILLGRTPAPKK